MTQASINEASRTLKNFSVFPISSNTVNPEVLEAMYDMSGGTVYCNGMLRCIVSEKITDNMYKVYTKPF